MWGKLIKRIAIGLGGLFIALKLMVFNTEMPLEQNHVNPAPQENVCVAMNYHYIRAKSIWHLLIEGATQTDELTKYTVYRDEFENQINQLIEAGAYFATLEEVELFRKTGDYPDKCVWISFDDGELSVYKNAFPFLKEKNIPFTLFLIAGQVGEKDFNNLELMDWIALKEMKESGLVSFGSHTYDMHYLEDDKAEFLQEEKYDTFRQDIRKSKRVIEEQLGVKINSIAYPFGNTTEQIAKIVEEEGFSSGFILAPSPIDQENSAYYQNRYMINRENFYEIFSEWFK